MKVLKRSSLAEQVVNEITKYIHDNNLQPGDKLPTENEFTQMLGVSRTSIREAIKALSINGVLVSYAGKGTFLSDKAVMINLEKDSFLLMKAYTTISDVMEVRTPLEMQAVRLAIERSDEDDIRELENICYQYEKAVQEGGQHAKWGRQFHAHIAQVTGNKMLVNMLQNLRYMTDLYRDNLAKKNIGVTYYVDSHKKICQAFREGNVEMGAREMQNHMELTLQALKKLAQEGDVNEFLPDDKVK